MDNENKEKIVGLLDDLSESDVNSIINYIETLKEKCQDTDDGQYSCLEAGP